MSKDQAIENENVDAGDEGGEEGGAAAAGAATDAENDGADGSNTDQDGGAGGDIYRPEGLADHLVGGNDRETIDKLSEAYLGARKELSKKRGVPEKLDDYSIDLPEDVAAAVLKPGEDGKDPFFEGVRGVLHKHNIPAEAATALVTDFYKEVMAGMEAGQAEGGDDGAFEKIDTGYTDFGGVDKAKPVVDGAMVFINGLKSSGKLSEGAAAELEILTCHNAGLKAINEIRSLLGDKPVPADIGGGHKGGVTKDELDKRVADPRHWTDKVFRAETEEMFKEFYGGGQKKA